MSEIIIGFSRPVHNWPPPLFAWAIMLVDWSNFSHVYIRFHSDSYDRDLVYQASGLRVNFMGWKRFTDHALVVKEFAVEVTPETKQAVIQFAIDNVGAPYAMGPVFGLVAVKIASLFGKKIKNPVSQQGHFCSELGALIFKDFLGGDLTMDDVRRMSPTDDYKMLVAKFGGAA